MISQESTIVTEWNLNHADLFTHRFQPRNRFGAAGFLKHKIYVSTSVSRSYSLLSLPTALLRSERAISRKEEISLRTEEAARLIIWATESAGHSESVWSNQACLRINLLNPFRVAASTRQLINKIFFALSGRGQLLQPPQLIHLLGQRGKGLLGSDIHCFASKAQKRY